MDGPPSRGSADTLAAPSSPRTTTGETAEHSAPHRAAIAESLRARYTLGEVLGRGGMGEVLSARDIKIGRAVAIKRLRVDATTPEATARFVREARIQGGLEHPAIVPVHELWDEETGQPFFVMRQVAGVTLAQVVERLAAGDPATIADYPRQRLLRAFAEVCLAIAFAHTRGVVHRDLKPANIVLGEFGEVYVLDWGVARVAGDAPIRADLADVSTLDAHETAAGTVLGTPGYMAPEQITGAVDLDGRADVYALGCILFELLALVPLHPRGKAALEATLVAKPTAPSALAGDRDIPPELDAICLRATRLDRGDRWAGARELGAAVQRFLDGDRDVNLRRELARAELDAARIAIARGHTARYRRRALRSAARALALDPSQTEPVALVEQLMLEPPTEVPREVETAVEELELDALEETRPLLIASGAMFLAFIPILWWTGFRSPTLYAISGTLAISVVLAAGLAPRPQLMLASRWILLAWIGLTAIFAVMTTPVLVAPGVAAAIGMSAASHRRLASRPVLIALLPAAIIVPWLLGVLGVLPTTVAVVGNTVVLTARTDVLDPTGTVIGLLVYVLMITTLPTLLSRRLALGRRDAQRSVQMQAWQLHQLVAPRASTEE